MCVRVHASCHMLQHPENTSTILPRMSVSTDVKLARSNSVCRIVMVKCMHGMQNIVNAYSTGKKILLWCSAMVLRLDHW